LGATLERRRRAGKLRELTPPGSVVSIDSDFSSNDYLGLAHDQTLHRYGRATDRARRPPFKITRSPFSLTRSPTLARSAVPSAVLARWQELAADAAAGGGADSSGANDDGAPSPSPLIGSTGSRLLSGNSAEHEAFEEWLAAFHGHEVHDTP
jgi:7-keto-8-aminopelargonate synthetase-like enzyme